MKKIFALTLLMLLISGCSWNYGNENGSIKKSNWQLKKEALEYRDVGTRTDTALYYPVMTNYEKAETSFNNDVKNLVVQERDAFLVELDGIELPRVTDPGSYFRADYEILNSQDFLSIKFVFDTYVSGAAHPNSFTKAYNFDLITGRPISWTEIFKPGSNYLQVVSDKSGQKLLAKNNEEEFTDIVSIREGTKPNPENFKTVNIADKRLIITFDAYQVASYAAGPQVIEIPFSDLYEILKDEYATKI